MNNQSRASAKCETPTLKSNAALTDLPLLECTDDNNGQIDSYFLPFEQEMNQDNNNNPSIVDPNELSFTNWSFDETYRLVHISWLPTMNMSYFGCDQVQVQCVPTVKGDDQPGRNSPKEVYSKPLECNNLKNHTLINVVREITYQFCPLKQKRFSQTDIKTCVIYHSYFRQLTLKSFLRAIHQKKLIIMMRIFPISFA